MGIIIRNAEVYLRNRLEKTDVRMDSGVIVQIGAGIPDGTDQVIEASGKMLLPGLRIHTLARGRDVIMGRKARKICRLRSRNDGLALLHLNGTEEQTLKTLRNTERMEKAVPRRGKPSRNPSGRSFLKRAV